MGLNRKLEDLEPKTRESAVKGVAILKAQGVRYWINETRRTLAIQEAYYAQGRQPREKVNAMRARAGLWLISEAENKTIVTSTLKSKHIEGKALDICPADKDGSPLWNAPKEEWQKISDVMKIVGFEWGGDWAGSWDRPHYQLREV